MGSGSLAIGAGIANAVLAVEVCGPLLLLCWLCCWPDDAKSETSGKGKSPKKLVTRTDSGSRRRLGESFIRRFGSSVTSLHLPSTSGYSKESLSAHRSHEEIPQRRKSQLEPRTDEETRYHSAPSVIHEVVHRRDWERSNMHLHIPLKSPTESKKGEEEPFTHEVLHRRDWSNTHLHIPLKSPTDLQVLNDSEDSSPEIPHAEPESSSIEHLTKSDEKLTCKKHYTNIKSSKNKPKKETNSGDDEKDTDATETMNNTRFYIGDTKPEEPDNSCVLNLDNDVVQDGEVVRFKAKEAKQCFNESIKSKEFSKSLGASQAEYDDLSFGLDRYRTKTFDIDLDLCAEEMDRSGAIHPGLVSRSSFRNIPSPIPAPSVEGYLAECGSMHMRVRALAGASARSRHASDGDILAPAHRPQSGAFSESDLDFDLDGCNERPPSYEEATDTPKPKAKETAI